MLDKNIPKCYNVVTVKKGSVIVMKEIMEKYGKGYSYMVVDNDGFYWEEFCGSLSAVGECGWNASIDDVCDITRVSVDEEDKIIYIYTNTSL